ncbi:unnamed protein product, partial [Vitis vinifera]|uniref:Uncharacterized protein n=1 Tax=Vitis vinifera TaxID=29760 RepID=D7TJW7_VITVI
MIVPFGSAFGNPRGTPLDLQQHDDPSILDPISLNNPWEAHLKPWICTKAPLVQGKVLTKPSKSIPIPKNISFQSPHIYIYGVSTLRSEANQTVGDCKAFLWPRVVLCFAWVVGKR